MGSPITLVTNVPAIKGVNQFDRLKSEMAKINERMTTGFRYNRFADGPAAMTRIVQLDTRIKSMTQAQENVSNSKSVVGQAQGGAESVIDNLKNIRTLVHSALNDDLDANQRTAIKGEIDGLVAAIDDTVRQTRHGSISLLDGSFTDKRIQTGTESSDSFTFGITQDFRSTGLSIDSLAVDTSANAATALTAVDAAITSATTATASIGSSYNRLSSIERTNEVTKENLVSVLSTIRDTNPLLDSMELANNQMRQQASIASIANAMNAQSLLLSLLGS